jgi:2-polyprenyl-3-methyl-5-hydroxy-6-metoxy-1,4-benzoquinol methylase
MIQCPLSESHNLILVQRILLKDLVRQYKRSLNIDISSEISDLQHLNLYHCPDSDLRFFYPPIIGSEEFYEKLQDFDWYYADDRYEYNHSQQFIRPSDSILEIGCGRGNFSKKISAKAYVGLEFSSKAVELAVKDNIRVLNQSIESHAKEHSQVYDVVCAFQVLEHVKDISSFIQSSVQCLKPNGFLIYSVPSFDSFVSLAVNNILNMPPHHISWWSDQCLKFLADRFGLEVIQIEHEPLNQIHKSWYLSTIILESLRQGFRLNFSILEETIQFRLLAKLSRLAGDFLASGFSDSRSLPSGHSVIAVYRNTQ